MTGDHARAAADIMTSIGEGEFPATCQVLAAVRDDNRDYKPDAKSRSAWELSAHLATTDVWFLHSIAEGAFVWDPTQHAASQFNSVSDIVAFYQRAIPESLQRLRTLDAERLTRDLSFFSAYNWPAVRFIGFFNNHSIHHRGQLAAYLRAMGPKVPNIYGPSADAK